MSFSVEETEIASGLRYTVRGYVNEQSVFPELRKANVIHIDLGQVKGLNSIGTRNWCEWVSRAGPPIKLIAEKCPALFVKSFNNVVGALPENMQVDSFYVPFVSPTDGGRLDVLIHSAQAKDGELILGEVKNAKGEVLEMDVLPDYFRFLKR